MQPEFKQYAHQVVLNARKLAEELVKRDFNLVSGGTDNHLMLIDLRNKGLTGKEATLLLDEVNITVNKNQIPNDTLPPMKSSGIRIGVPAMTTKGWKENDFEQLAGIINGFLINLKNNLVDDDLIDLFKKQVKHLKDKVNERNNKNG